MALTQLRYFYEVARSGSIREASLRLSVSPSSVSRQIQNLEHDVRTPLFERRARGMSLTDAGELYFTYVSSVLAELDRLHSDLDDLRGLRRGRVRIYTIEGIVADTLVVAIAGFREKYPNVTFDVTVAGTDLVAAAVQAAETDIGITFNAEPNVDMHFAFRVLDPLYAIMHPSHPLAERRKVRLAEVLNHPIAIPEVTFGIRRLINRCCQAQQLRLKPAVVTNSIAGLRAFARANAGITMLPMLSILGDLEMKALAAVPFSDSILRQSSIDVCVTAGRKLPISAAAFLDHLESCMAAVRKIVRY